MMFTPAIRAALLCKVITYCANHLAEISVHPYRDSREQARMAEHYRSTIDRAAHHLRGYRMVGREGSGYAYWTRTFECSPNMAAGRWADAVNA